MAVTSSAVPNSSLGEHNLFSFYILQVLHRAANKMQAVGRQFFNPRLVPEEVSDQLSGFAHNAVSPVGLATPIPIIMSDRVAALQPRVFWLGGGEPDLKCADRFAKLKA